MLKQTFKAKVCFFILEVMEMGRVKTFTFRATADERRIIAALAEKLQRSRSDAVRWLVLESARELGIEFRTAPQDRAAQTSAPAQMDAVTA